MSREGSSRRGRRTHRWGSREGSSRRPSSRVEEGGRAGAARGFSRAGAGRPGAPPAKNLARFLKGKCALGPFLSIFGDLVFKTSA
jgi:hypothetical protein